MAFEWFKKKGESTVVPPVEKVIEDENNEQELTGEETMEKEKDTE